MAIEVGEKLESRRISTNPLRAELEYWIRGTDQEQDAIDALKAAISTTYSIDLGGFLPVALAIESVTLEPLGSSELWTGIVTYSQFASVLNESVFSFDTGGGTHHITQSQQTVVNLPATANHNGAIGVTNDSVEGVDIVVPAYRWSESYVLPPAQVSPLLYRALTGCVNSSTFKGFAAGEVLFLGASGTKRGDGDWEISFGFLGSPNATGIPVPGLGSVDKLGHDYLWFRYAEDVADNKLIKKPTEAHVERVYRYANLNLLGLS